MKGKFYGKLIYQYCKNNNVKHFRPKWIINGIYPELKENFAKGEIRHGLLYLQERGLAKKDGASWLILFEKQTPTHMQQL